MPNISYLSRDIVSQSGAAFLSLNNHKHLSALIAYYKVREIYRETVQLKAGLLLVLKHCKHILGDWWSLLIILPYAQDFV